jgi:hypothetical protein
MSTINRLFRKGKNQDKLTIAVFVVGIGIIILLLFGSQIKSMVQSISGGSRNEKTELSGTDIVFEVGKIYTAEYIGDDIIKISDRNGQSVVFAELELQGNQMRVFEDKDGKRHKFYVSGSVTYMGTVE